MTEREIQSKWHEISSKAERDDDARIPVQDKHSTVSDLVLARSGSRKTRANFVEKMLPPFTHQVSPSTSGTSSSLGNEMFPTALGPAFVPIRIPKHCTNVGVGLPINGLPVLMSSVMPQIAFVNKDFGLDTAPSSVIGKASLAEFYDDEHEKKADSMQCEFSSQSMGSILHRDQGKSLESVYEQQKRIITQSYEARVQIPEATLQKANATVPLAAGVGVLKDDMVGGPIATSRHTSDNIIQEKVSRAVGMSESLIGGSMLKPAPPSLQGYSRQMP